MSTIGCDVIKSAIHSLRSTQHFIPFSADNRVLYEPGAEKFAEQMAVLLPQAIEQVEKGQYRSFSKGVTIYICASQESYTRFTGLKAPASLTLKGVFFSPRLVKEKRPLLLYLTHELSHLHIEQQIGQYKFAILPAWFKEGLAALVSNGGGAQNVSEAQAIEAFKNGKHFEPNTAEGIFFRKYGSYWDLPPHLFYRQSMMFVSYLKENNENQFRRFLLQIEDGRRFIKAFNDTFDNDMSGLWNDFLKDIMKNNVEALHLSSIHTAYLLNIRFTNQIPYLIVASN
jgi:hypothetical protein